MNILVEFHRTCDADSAALCSRALGAESINEGIVMNARNNETARSAATIEIWENEGGASGRDSMDHLFGRRIEADRSWTVYHVFTGIPARADE
jgi:hypothetical protein